MAFHLIFRDPDRTLTEEEVNREMEKINKALKEFGAEIR
jgi:phenylalanyl-tRNA synthetase beta subunit